MPECKLKFSDNRIRVGTPGDYQPYSYWNAQSGQFEGVDIEMALQLGKELGVEVQFVRFRWPDLVDDLLADRFDIAMGGITRDLIRARDVAFTDSCLTYGTCPLVRRGDGDRYGSLDAIDGADVRVVLNQGGSNDKYFSGILKNATVIRHPRNDEIASLVVSGAADVWLTDNVEALFWEKQFPELRAVNPMDTLTVGTKGYLIRQGNQSFLNWLNLWLEQMRLQGEIARIEKNWLNGII